VDEQRVADELDQPRERQVLLVTTPAVRVEQPVEERRAPQVTQQGQHRIGQRQACQQLTLELHECNSICERTNELHWDKGVTL